MIISKKMTEKCESGSCGKCGGYWCKIIIRVLVAAIFIYAGYGKLADIAGTAGYIAGVMGVSAGTATFFAWGSGLLELIAGVLIVVGYFRRYAAWALVIFTLVATYFFHLKGALAGDSMQWVQVLKNLSIVGGLLALGEWNLGCHFGPCAGDECCKGGKCEHGENHQ